MLLAFGQETRIKDVAGTLIKVGDLLKTGKGEYWDINTYLQAVPRHAAMAIDIKQFIFQYPHARILTKDEGEKIEKVLGVPEIVKESNYTRRPARPTKTNQPMISHQADEVKGEKYCPHCKQIRPLSEFHKSKKNIDGYQAWCRTCVNNYYKEKGTTRKKK